MYRVKNAVCEVFVNPVKGLFYELIKRPKETAIEYKQRGSDYGLIVQCTHRKALDRHWFGRTYYKPLM